MISIDDHNLQCISISFRINVVDNNDDDCAFSKSRVKLITYIRRLLNILDSSLGSIFFIKRTILLTRIKTLYGIMNKSINRQRYELNHNRKKNLISWLIISVFTY